MRSIHFLVLVFLISCPVVTALGQSVASFPFPNVKLVDAKHKEPKSGVQIGPGNTITIQQGVGTPSAINVLSFTQDGKLLAAGKDFGRVVVWDVPERTFLAAVEGHQGIVHAVAISPDGQLLATAGEGDGFNIKLWHLPDGKLINTYQNISGYVQTLAFGPSGTWFVLSDNTGKTRVLDVTTGKQLVDLGGSYWPILSPDGSTLMTITGTEFLLWKTSDWTKQRTLPSSPGFAMPLALNPQSDSFIITFSGIFRLARLSSGELLPNLPAPSLPKFNLAAGGFASFVPATPLVFGHSDDRLWVWDSSTGQTCVSELMYSESGALSPDGTILAGAKDNSFLAQTRSGVGAWLWDTKQLAAKCGLHF
jgi:WD40 repeat protein